MLLFLAILLLSCAQFGSQLFLPALPDIATSFNITNSDAQQIIMLYFFSFGLSQLLFGPWSDNVGRRKVFLFGQLLFIAGSLLCIIAETPAQLAIARFIQGFGAGSPLIVGRTLLSDQFDGNRLKQIMASLAIATSIISVLAPLLGGWIVTKGNLQLLFLSLAIYLIISFIIGFRLLPPRKKRPRKLPMAFVLKQYIRLLTQPKFITPSLFKWLPTLLYLSSATFLPFELQQKLSLSPQQYGFYMMLPVSGLILGTSMVRYIQRYYSYQNILVLFWPLLVLAGLGLYFLPFSLFNCLLCYSLFMICAGAYYPCCMHLLVEPYRHKTGTVNALSGAIDMLLFSALAALVNQYWVVNTSSLGVLYLMMACLLAVNWFVMHKHSTQFINQTAVSNLNS